MLGPKGWDRVPLSDSNRATNGVHHTSLLHSVHLAVVMCAGWELRYQYFSRPSLLFMLAAFVRDGLASQSSTLHKRDYFAVPHM